LNQVAVIGLQALDDLENNRSVTAQDRQHNLGLLQSAEQPQAILLDMVAPSVELLVQATRTE
jgi:hexosaminidase